MPACVRIDHRQRAKTYSCKLGSSLAALAHTQFASFGFLAACTRHPRMEAGSGEPSAPPPIAGPMAPGMTHGELDRELVEPPGNFLIWFGSLFAYAAIMWFLTRRIVKKRQREMHEKAQAAFTARNGAAASPGTVVV